jgi:hypothetical protein
MHDRGSGQSARHPARLTALTIAGEPKTAAPHLDLYDQFNGFHARSGLRLKYLSDGLDNRMYAVTASAVGRSHQK